MNSVCETQYWLLFFIASVKKPDDSTLRGEGWLGVKLERMQSITVGMSLQEEHEAAGHTAERRMLVLGPRLPLVGMALSTFRVDFPSQLTQSRNSFLDFARGLAPRCF